MKRFFLLLISLCSAAVSMVARPVNDVVPEGDATYTTQFVEYKHIDSLSLKMFVVTPDNIAEGETRPAVVFIHGGAWEKGDYSNHESHCRYFATKGLVAISINYRVTERDHSTPYESLLDAKSAIRFIRANAAKFHIDPDKIIAGGGSAGGHLAAAATMCPAINDPQDDLGVSSEVAALILFNPVVCNGPDAEGAYKGYGYERVKEYYKEFSPIHNIRAGVPPTVFMVGDNDVYVSEEMAHEYKRLIEQAGGRCDLHIYPGQKHGFYHFGNNVKASKRNFYTTTTEAHNFLQSLGYLSTPATVDKWLDAQRYGYVY